MKCVTRVLSARVKKELKLGAEKLGVYPKAEVEKHGTSWISTNNWALSNI